LGGIKSEYQNLNIIDQMSSIIKHDFN